ncbi:MAG: glycosyltransferase, partial [Bacteroidota bacterium]
GIRFTFSSKVSFRGMIGGKEEFKLLNESKGLIFPVRWHEPFGLAIIESLYFGCPVFGTRYGSLPELVHEDVGFLSDQSDELVKAILNNDYYSRKKCHEYVVEEFNSKKMTMAYVKKYELVISGKKLNFNPPKLSKIQEEKWLEWK